MNYNFQVTLVLFLYFCYSTSALPSKPSLMNCIFTPLGCGYFWCCSYLVFFQCLRTTILHFSTGFSSIPTVPLKQDVPQGSVLGPVLFIIDIFPLESYTIMALNYHFYSVSVHLLYLPKPTKSLPVSMK